MFIRPPARRSRHSSAFRSPDYQALEQRILLTTFYVNTTADSASGSTDGLLSFREALIAANTNAAFGDAAAGEESGDAIRFTADVQNQVISTANGSYVITDDLLIQGGSFNVTFDGQGSNRIFLESTSERVAFGRLTFQNGEADQGGAIASTGGGRTLVVDSIFEGNVATGAGGGAIYHELGNLYVTDSTFDGNQATEVGSSGGAILHASGISSLRRVTLTSNTAMGNGGGVEIGSGNVYFSASTIGTATNGNAAVGSGSLGGGVHVASSSAITLLAGSTVQGNTAEADGGGVWNQTGAELYLRSGTVISDNIGMLNGGGIFNDGGRVYMTNSTVSDNVAQGAAGSGGGVYSAGGVFNAARSTISGNSAARSGGGLELVNGFGRLSNVALSGNDAGVNLTAAPGNGGGIHVAATSTLLTVDGTLIDSNLAAGDGGGIWNDVGATLYLQSGTTISGNTASGGGAGEGGGGIFNHGGRVYAAAVVIANNRASGGMGSGGGIFSTAGAVTLNASSVQNNAAKRSGGGVELIDGYFGMTDSDLTGNDAGITISPGVPGSGGGLHVAGLATTVFDNTAVTGNRAALEGGGLWNQVGANMYLNNGTSIMGNLAGSSAFSLGGGIYNNGYLSVLDAAFSDNSSNGNGGGLRISSTGEAFILRTEFRGNGSQARGGGIANGNRMRVVDSAFIANTAFLNGGGIYTEIGAQTFLDNVTFDSNLPNGAGSN